MRSIESEQVFPPAIHKDKALNTAEQEKFHVPRQDVPMEVCRVPLRTKIEFGKYTNHTTSIQEMESSTDI